MCRPNFSPFNSWNVLSALLKMWPPEKCELRTLEVGPKRRFNLQKVTTYVKLSEKCFFDRPTFLHKHFQWAGSASAISAWHGRPPPPPPPLHIDLRIHEGTTDCWCRWLAQGICVQLHIENFEPNPANETTWQIGPLIPRTFGGRSSQVCNGALHQNFAHKRWGTPKIKAHETWSAQCMQWNECSPFLRPSVLSLFRLQG